MTKRIMQFGDVHLDRSTEENAAHAMEQLVAAARELQPDLIVNTGDLAMKRGSLEPWVAAALRNFHTDLADVAPVVVVAGNHDLVYEDGRADSLVGALKFSAAADRIHLASTACVLDVAGVQVACLPYPSRHVARAAGISGSREEVNAQMSAMLGDVARSLGAQVERNRPAVLVYHGTVDGASPGTESVMTTEMDILLRQGDIPDVFDAVMAGHIHRPQTVGPAVYAGSPCPLAFSEETYAHGFEMWEINLVTARHEFHELPPRHRLVTLDFREHGDSVVSELVAGYFEAKVRIRLRLPRGTNAEFVTSAYRTLMAAAGAHSVQFDIEREAEDHSSAIEVQATAAPAELLRLYAQRHPDVEPYRDEIEALGVEIDAALPPEARVADRASEYRLRSVRWSNWRSMAEEPGEIVFDDDLGRLVCIEGPNAAGKSNVAEVEAFALWGRVPRGGLGLAEMVRQGCRSGFVEAVFTSGGEVWRVRREVSVNAKGIGAAEVTLQRAGRYFDDDHRSITDLVWAAASGGTARETQKIIEGLVGSFDLYLSTRFASQGDIDRLLDMTPAALKDALQEALGAPLFEARQAAGTKALSARRVALSAAEIQAREVEDAEARLVEAEASVDGIARGEAAARDADASAADALATARESLGYWREQLAARQAVKEAGDAVQAEHDAALSESSRIGRESEALRARIAGLEERASKAARLVELEPQVEAWRQADQRERDAIEAVKRANEAAATARRQATDAVRTAEDKRRLLSAAVTAANRALERDIEAAEALDRAPFGTKCAEAGCSLVAGAAAARDRRAAGWAAVQAAEGAVAAHDAATQARVAELESEAARLSEAVLVARRAATEAAAVSAGLVGARDEHSALKRAGVETAAADHQAAVAELRRVDEAGAAAAERLAAAAAKLQGHGGGPDVESARRAVMDCERDLAQAEVAKKHAETELGVATAALNRRQGEIDAYRARVEAGRGAREAMAGRQRAVTVAELYVRAMGRDGLPLLMLERAIPALEAHANAFLGGGLSLVLEANRMLQSGETRGEVVLRYSNPFGTHGVAAASGFERVALGYALRAALAQVQAESHGVRVAHWWADEGWGAFDEANVLMGQQMLRRLADAFQRVLFISHVGAIRQVAETVLTVVPDAEHGSRLVSDRG